MVQEPEADLGIPKTSIQDFDSGSWHETCCGNIRSAASATRAEGISCCSWEKYVTSQRYLPTLKGNEVSLSYVQCFLYLAFFNECLYFSYYMAGYFLDIYLVHYFFFYFYTDVSLSPPSSLKAMKKNVPG